MNFLKGIFNRAPRRPKPSYSMYENTATSYEGNKTMFGCSLVGNFSSLDSAKEYALSCIDRKDTWRHIQSYDLFDDYSCTTSGYAVDNWELTPKTRQWTYYKETKATGPFLYNADGRWLGWNQNGI